MLKSSVWLKGIVLLSIMVLLLLSSCTFAAPASQTPPASASPPPAPENQKPVINYVTSQQQVTPLSSSRITCVATDADGDTITYAWSAEKGQITGTGDTITWTAPEAAGSYNVSVSVTDGKGGEVKDSVTIAVTPKPNHAPIVSLIVREKNEPPITFVQGTPPVKVKRWSTTEIECKAEDPDGDAVTYKWGATGGKIEGEGPRVIYIATTAGDFGVTVTVTDSKGAQTKMAAFFHVPCCGQG
jgi:hypothetical protein